ncbi:MAG: aminodeoxychorismate lyase, partial [Stenotrophomonas sp.]
MAGAKRGCLFVVTLLVVLAAIVAGAGAWFFYKQNQFADVPLTPSADSVVIASGDGMNSVLRKLRE